MATFSPRVPAASRRVAQLVLAALLATPGPAFAETAYPVPPPAIAVLLRQARFWNGQHDRTQAIASLQRARLIAPADPQVLALAAELEGATTDLAIAYFRKLGRTADGWERARDGLADLVRRDPAALGAQLAYAQLLTERAGAARADGVGRLENLAQRPDMAAAAAAALQKARQWDEAEAVAAPGVSADARAALAKKIAEGVQLDPVVARDRLLRLAAAPDPDGTRGAAIARALAAAGQGDAAGEAIEAAMAATPDALPVARLAYAHAYLDIGDLVSLQTMLAGMSAIPIGATDRAEMTHLLGAVAVSRADALNAHGRQAAAFRELAPFLAADDPAAKLALGRLYLAAQRPLDALAVDEPVLRADPANAAARQLLVEASLATHDRARAVQLVADGKRLTPDDPRVWLAAATLDRADGNAADVLGDLRHAEDLHQAPRAAAEPSGTVAAMLSPGDVAPDLSVPPPTQAPDVEGGDGDPVVIRGHMLDTDATELLPPSVLCARAAAASPPAPAAPPFMAHSVPIGPTLRAAVDPAGISPAAPVAPLAAAPAAALPANPFHDKPDAGVLLADATPVTPGDPVSARIDTEISDLTGQEAPAVQTSVAFRGRSGTAGLGQLGELTVPLEAVFSAGEDAKLHLAVTPTFLGAGSVPAGAHAQSQFGSLALALRGLPGGGANGPSIDRQDATGTGLNVALLTPHSSADVGTTPLGFRQQSVVGGLQWAPEIIEGVRLRLTGERRAVTDSVLSYAGTRDPVSGQNWGGVTLARGRADLEADYGTFKLYGGGGGGGLEGHDVKWNTEIEAGAGGSFAALKDPSQELRLGLDLIYASYGKNMSGFTLGQGGYFSPQSYFAALFPATWRGQLTNDLRAEIGGSAGVQTYRVDSSPYFPLSGPRQAALVAQQDNPATALGGVATTLPARSRTDFAGGAHGMLDYTLTPAFHIGAKADYEHTGTWNEVLGLVYGRYLLGSTP